MSGRNVKIAGLSKKTIIKKSIVGKESHYGYNINRIYQSINSSLQVLSANHLFGNCIENRSLELFDYKYGFSLLNNSKNLNLSYKTDLDFWDCLGRGKPLSYS